MIIKKAELNNFGKYYQKEIHFAPGINIVCGENESGKSTLQHFLTGMLFGIEKQRGRAKKNDRYQQYEPWNSPSYYAGSLEMEIGEKSFVLERNFYHKEKSVRLFNREDKEELSVEHGDLDMLLGGMSRQTYENTYCIPQAAVQTEQTFGEEMKNFLVNAAGGGEAGVDLQEAFGLLLNRKKEAEQKQKDLARERAATLERLNWQNELLAQDIEQLTQKLAQAEAEEKIESEPEPPSIDIPISKEVPKRRISKVLLLVAVLLLWRFGGGRILNINQMPLICLEIILWISCFLWIGILLGKKNVDNSIQNNDTKIAAINMLPQPDRASQMIKEQLEERLILQERAREAIEEAIAPSAAEREAEQTAQAAALASETLERVREKLYQEGQDKLQDFVSEIFSTLTDQTCQRAELTPQLELVISQGDKMLLPWQLSRGTMEQLYFSLRLGAGRSFTHEEAMPILLDEPFGAYDDVRLMRTLEWLHQQPEQVILFTCQKREQSMLTEMGISYHIIYL